MTDEEKQKKEYNAFRYAGVCVYGLDRLQRDYDKIISVLKDNGKYDDNCKEVFDKYVDSIVKAKEVGTNLEDALSIYNYYGCPESNTEKEEEENWDFDALPWRLEDNHFNLVMVLHSMAFENGVMGNLHDIDEDEQYKQLLDNFEKALDKVLDVNNDALTCIYDITDTPNSNRRYGRPHPEPTEKEKAKEAKEWKKIVKRSLKDSARIARKRKRERKKLETSKT